MAEDGSTIGRQPDEHKFLSKHRWRAKIFSNDEALAKETNQKFRLNDDVVDFLKPSTMKAAHPSPPKIDIAAAQRWPGASDLKKTASPTPPSAMRTTRPSRRKGLTVSFVRAAPEIIGEGGDESEIPAIEIGKSREAAVKYASLFDSSTAQDDSKLGTRSSSGISGSDARMADSHPKLLQRSQTSFNELSPPLKEKFESDVRNSPNFTPKDDEDPSFRPRPIQRTQTGYMDVGSAPGRPSLDSMDSDISYQVPPPITRKQTEFETGVGQQQGGASRLPNIDDIDEDEIPLRQQKEPDFLETEPSNPNSFSAKVQHKMRAEEGRALHEAAKDAVAAMQGTMDRPLSSGSQTSTKVPPSHTPSRSDSKSSQLSHPLPAVATPPQQHAGLAHPQSAQHYHMDDITGPSNYLASSPKSSLRPTPSPQPASVSSRGVSPSGLDQPTRSRMQKPEHHDTEKQVVVDFSKQAAPLQLEQDPGMQVNVEQPLSSPPIRLDQDPGLHAVISGDRTPGDIALDDFGARVTHMSNIFRLTSEFEKPMFEYSPMQWLRGGIWWLLRGRSGLEAMLRNRSKGEDGRPNSGSSVQRDQRLLQPHVDLAKTWWILTNVLPQYPHLSVYSGDRGFGPQAISARSRGDHYAADVLSIADILLGNLKAVFSSMSRNQMMPPFQSLMQGHDQSIWVKYPNFTPDVQAILSGTAKSSLLADHSTNSAFANPLSLMPLGDSRTDFCYGRMFVQASLSTDDQESDRVPLICVLSILRGHGDLGVKAAICSQSELVNLVIHSDSKRGGSHGISGPTWENDVQWKIRQSRGLYVRLPRGFTLSVDLSEADYRSLHSIYHYTQTIGRTIAPAHDEKLVYDATIREFQQSSAPLRGASPAPGNAAGGFPSERVHRPRLRVFEKIDVTSGVRPRRFHSGYRVAVVTNPKGKSLSSIEHKWNMTEPIIYEFVVDGHPSKNDAGPPPPAMVLRAVKDQSTRVTFFVVFNDAAERNHFYMVLNGIVVAPGERVFAQVTLLGLSIAPVDNGGRISPTPATKAIERFNWQDLRVTMCEDLESPGTMDHAPTVLSESLRVTVRHAAGSMTDRLNLGPGEMLFRLDTDGSPRVHLLRAAQSDMSSSIWPAKLSHDPSAPDALVDLVRSMHLGPTVRTLSFPSLKELHTFQQAVTGFYVRYDSIASTFAISRRRMVVPIYKRWEASRVRVQVVAQAMGAGGGWGGAGGQGSTSGSGGGGGMVTMLLAFFEGFAHSDAMGFLMKSMDVFEKDGKTKIKLVDAKFALPPEKRDKDEAYDGAEPQKRRFVSLDMPEYPGEHDDITIGFETEAERDRFSAALPAAMTIGRMVTFKRKI